MSEKEEKVVSVEEVEIIKEWLKSQPHLPDHMSDKIIKLFIYRCKHSLQKTKSFIDKFCTIKSNIRSIFWDRDPFSEKLKIISDMVDLVNLPGKTKDNYRVLFLRYKPHNPDDLDIHDVIKYAYMLMDLMLELEPRSLGVVVIIDCHHSTLKMLGQLPLSTLKMISVLNQQGYPLKPKQMHFINITPFYEKMFLLFRPGLMEKSLKNIHLHTEGSETVFDYVPKEMIPCEYGGTGESIVSLGMKSTQLLQDNREFFVNEKPWIVDETMRPIQNADDILNQGSFKTLMID